MTTPLRRADIMLECFRNLSWERDTPEPRNNEELLTDLIADLFHWAWEVDEDFQECVDQAISHGRTERRIQAFSRGELV